ncbi:MAG: TetR/AcrR family transcriptional regulator [Myxococcota bacterium]|nr:TetR/AcrR family transcriptional regulator [Myxococcota bacterium]
MSSAPATPSERRRSQQREEARRAILDATESLLVELGYEGFSMRRLAERCGYTAPTIYHHFGDKQGLLDSVVEARFRLALDRVLDVPEHDDPADTAREILMEFARFSLENPTHYHLLSLPRGPDAKPVESAERARGLLEAPLAELARRGRLATDDVEQAVAFLWIVLQGYLSLRLRHPDVEWRPDMLSFSMERALRGLVLPAPEEERSAYGRADA